jgi:serine/threonine-protein kinase
LVLLLGLLGGLLWLLASSLGVFDQDDTNQLDQVEVPRVVDLPVDQARQILEDLGLVVSEEAEQVADAAQVGLVLSQNPENGIRVDAGSTVTIVVGSQNTFPMPNLAGSTPEQARNTLTGLGFTGEFREQPQESAEVEAGEIIATEPAAGQQVATTATITLIVSSGPPQTEVPSCDTLTESDCVTRITGAGFTPQVAQEASGTVEEGRVTRTDPAAGTLADNGATIRIFVSTGPEVKAVPPVVGLGEAAATAALQNAGFRVSVQQEARPTGDPEIGRVVAQNPAGNSNAEAGTTVTITVAVDGGPGDVGD